MKLAAGLYEALVTCDRARAIEELEALVAETEPLGGDAAPHVLGRHLYELLIKALAKLPEKERLAQQVELANRVVELLASSSPNAGIDGGDGIPEPTEVLLALREARATGLGEGHMPRPSLPLRHSDLLVNGPRDLRVGAEIRRELPSADRVDLLVAFLRWSGLRVVRPQLEAFARGRPGKLRILTTTYLGASDVEALDALATLGADIRISYDTRRTRLHAKAWLFHRESGFSTALVGSSNLSHAALLDGCEWNVRLAAVDNAAILDKFAATFDQYWDEGEFEAYDRDRFLRATARPRDGHRDALARALRLRPYPHQQEVLDALAEERRAGYTKNLVVAATGTGKTVVAALDYARLRRERGEARLLFIAHRREILEQSLATFRTAVRDGHFGELLVGRDRPRHGSHVFASVQSLHDDRLERLAPDAYDVVIVDEFHHAEAPTYRRLLDRLRPDILLGLTATPERGDGKSILGWFDGRVAAELRLWDALDLGLLVPFQYFGIHDGTDLSQVDFRAGHYDVGTLDSLYTGDHVRARAVLRAVERTVRAPRRMRALGFCVSVRHAAFMAAFCREHGLPALAVTGDSPAAERDAARRALERLEVNVLFTVDLFNEGIDLPDVDTVLFLRPTESVTLFLQQLGRGLRLADGKDCLTVLDFIGDAHRKFRFDRRFGALIGGTRAAIARAVDEGFPRLPAGSEIQLDPGSRKAVLANVRAAIQSGWRGMADDLAAIGDVGLAEFLRRAELDLEDVYRRGCSFTALKHQAGLRPGPAPRSKFTAALPRLLHIDDPLRLETWRGWLAAVVPPAPDPGDPMQLMLLAAIDAGRPVVDLGGFFTELWAEPELRAELGELLGVLADRRRRPTAPISGLPFHLHATYSRSEVIAGLGQVSKGKLLPTQSGVYKDDAARTDILFVTLEKDERHFTPTTLYNDYPLSPTRFHWESQSATRADSPTGRRYQTHASDGWRVLLFVRPRLRDDRGLTMPYLFLGPVRYVSHQGEKPMQIVWELDHPMPPDFYRRIKIAAG